MLHVFNRNHKGSRRDDGNPLVYAIKGRQGFSILPEWKSQLMERAKLILDKSSDVLQGYDFVLPMPSTSPFCGEFAEIAASIAGAPVLSSDFLRKRRVAEVLAQLKADPPRIRAGLRTDYASLLYRWERLPDESLYQAKEVKPALRAFCNPFALHGDLPVIQGKRILIVDDIFATGSSLLSVREIVANQLGADVGAVFFLSGI